MSEIFPGDRLQRAHFILVGGNADLLVSRGIACKRKSRDRIPDFIWRVTFGILKTGMML